MIVFESEAVRRLVGRFEQGEELPEAVERLARERDVQAGWIRAHGTLEWVELCLYDPDRRDYAPARRLDAPCEVLVLEGSVSVEAGKEVAHLHALVSGETGAGVEVRGGRLVSAGVLACEFTFECYDDLELRRSPDEATGMSLWVGPAGARAAGEGEGGQVTWAQVAQASEGTPQPEPPPRRRRKTEQEFMREQHPVRGDYIEHRHFGLCRVDGEDAEGGLRIRLPRGVRKVIKLDYLEVLPPREEDGHRVFPVHPRGRR